MSRDHVFEQHDVRLQCGAVLPRVVTAYRTRGTLASDRGNVILVTHGYTGGPDMIDDDRDHPDSWGGLIGPGRAIDTDRYFVISPNALGSCFGSTHAASIDPATNRPYGSRFPEITITDIVAGQRALVVHLGIERLVAVAGPSFGGAQALQWGVDYPDAMKGLVAVITAPTMPGLDIAALKAELDAVPDFHHGDYYGRGDMTAYLVAKRVGGLQLFGADAALLPRCPDPDRRKTEIARLARDWAGVFDANTLLIIGRAMALFDVREQLGAIRAPLLYVLSRSDQLFPAMLAPGVMTLMRDAGVDARFVEIDSDHGHFASSTDAAKWAEALRTFLAEIDPRPQAMEIKR
jgi:homoserine O-acetyltransferase/O-succinyltransferase